MSHCVKKHRNNVRLGGMDFLKVQYRTSKLLYDEISPRKISCLVFSSTELAIILSKPRSIMEGLQGKADITGNPADITGNPDSKSHDILLQ